MTASDYYYLELCRSFGITPKEQERVQKKKQKPKRLSGGCLLYRLPVRKAKKRKMIAGAQFHSAKGERSDT